MGSTHTAIWCLSGLVWLLCSCHSRTVPAVDAGRDVDPSVDLRPDRARADGLRPARDGGDAGLALTEEAARACIIASSCMAGLKANSYQPFTASRCLDGFAYLDWPRMSYNMDHNRAPSRRVLQCAKSFTTCEAFFHCYGGNWISFSLCREGGSCMANRLVSYQNNVYYLDCSSYKAKCVNLPTGAIRGCCAVKTCAATSSTTCNGAKGTHCLLGVSFDFDCAPTNRQCSTDTSVMCAGKGASCPTLSKPKCAGSKATYCAGGRLSTYDCVNNSFRSACDDNSHGIPCKPADAQCGPDWKGQCNGTRLGVCLNGTRMFLDCAKLGFSGCSVTNTQKVAHCQ